MYLRQPLDYLRPFLLHILPLFSNVLPGLVNQGSSPSQCGRYGVVLLPLPFVENAYSTTEDVNLLLELGLCALCLLVELLDCVLVVLDSVHEGGYLMVAP